MSKRLAVGALFVSLVWFVGCHSMTHQVFSVTVTPSSASVAQKGQTFQFQATAVEGTRKASGPDVVTSQASWSSANPAIATVAAGNVKAVGCGETTITADFGGVLGDASFTSSCSQPSTALQSITVFPANPTIAEIGQTSQFAALAQFNDGTTLDVTNSVKWASNNTNLATIDSHGLATGVSCGTATITAQDGAVAGQTNLNVACTVPDRVELLVIKSGSTAATIVSSPAGVNCGTTCDALFDEATGVTLTAVPTPTSWRGCDQILSGNVCSLTVTPLHLGTTGQELCNSNQPAQSGLCRQVTAVY
jgi:Bacterial Ig-like domain (group 2)